MSLATQLLTLFVRDQSYHGSYITLSTAQFCEMLERAVDIMQQPDKHLLEHLTGNGPFMRAFIRMVRR